MIIIFIAKPTPYNETPAPYYNSRHRKHSPLYKTVIVKNRHLIVKHHDLVIKLVTV